MRSRDKTLVVSPTKACTSRSASAASSGDSTVPVSSTKPFIVFAEMLAPGIASDSIWSIVSMLLPTRATVEKTTRPLASVA